MLFPVVNLKSVQEMTDQPTDRSQIRDTLYEIGIRKTRFAVIKVMLFNWKKNEWDLPPLINESPSTALTHPCTLPDPNFGPDNTAEIIGWWWSWWFFIICGGNPGQSSCRGRKRMIAHLYWLIWNFSGVKSSQGPAALNGSNWSTCCYRGYNNNSRSN